MSIYGNPVMMGGSGGGGGGIAPSIYGELFKSAFVSKTSGDRFYRDNRYFTRNSAEPIIVVGAAWFVSGSISYSGYGVISFSSAGVTGTYTQYGKLSSASKKTTPNGTDYWFQYQEGMYPPSTANGKMKIVFNTNGTLEFIIDASQIVWDNSSSFVGDADLITAMNALIDSVYQTYYA